MAVALGQVALVRASLEDPEALQARFEVWPAPVGDQAVPVKAALRPRRQRAAIRNLPLADRLAATPQLIGGGPAEAAVLESGQAVVVGRDRKETGLAEVVQTIRAPAEAGAAVAIRRQAAVVAREVAAGYVCTFSRR